jgi:KDO2-lipid IV(A) lauroyltransferase
MSHPLKYRLEYWLALVLSGLMRQIPLGPGRYLGTALGQLAFSVVRLRRKVTLENLRQAFPELPSRRERIKLGARCYRHLGCGLVEFCHFPRLNRDRLSELLDIQGLDFLRQALRGGRGAILLSGHFGAWELLGPAFALNGFAVDLFVRSQKNPFFDDLMNRHRSGVGADIIRSSRTPRAILRSLQQNRLLVMLADQDGGRDGIFIPFMGRPASTAPGVARFALRAGAPILMGFIVRQPDKRHRLIIEPPMERATGEGPQEDLHQILQVYTWNLEAHIRAHPHQWFWPHRRWKTRPPREKNGLSPPVGRSAGGRSSADRSSGDRDDVQQ